MLSPGCRRICIEGSSRPMRAIGMGWTEFEETWLYGADEVADVGKTRDRDGGGDTAGPAQDRGGGGRLHRGVQREGNLLCAAQPLPASGGASLSGQRQRDHTAVGS